MKKTLKKKQKIKYKNLLYKQNYNQIFKMIKTIKKFKMINRIKTVNKYNLINRIKIKKFKINKKNFHKISIKNVLDLRWI